MMDMALADKAYRLSKAGKTGPEIAKAIGVRYAADANAHASVGYRRARRAAARLTEPELLLLRSLAADERAIEARGGIRSPKSPDVSCRARKGSGWANATATKRLDTRRKYDHPQAAGSGYRFVSVAGNGHMSLTDAGWAIVHEIERAECEERKICTGCGSRQSIEEIRATHPKALSCCPERKMVPVAALEISRLREAIARAAKTFRGYAALHAAKNTEEGDAKRATNEVLAEEMEAALAKAGDPA